MFFDRWKEEGVADIEQVNILQRDKNKLSDDYEQLRREYEIERQEKHKLQNKYNELLHIISDPKDNVKSDIRTFYRYIDIMFNGNKRLYDNTYRYCIKSMIEKYCVENGIELLANPIDK